MPHTASPQTQSQTVHRLEVDAVAALIDLLHQQGYQVIAPKIVANAVTYQPVKTMAELPQGWSDSQAAGQYRIQPENHRAYFKYNLGPQSWKQYLFPPRHKLWQTHKDDNGSLQFFPAKETTVRYAFIGVRACEIAAIDVQDRVFLAGETQDNHYQQHRSEALIIAVNCSKAASTCFCTSMNTGPSVSSGYDLALTEIETKNQHYFLLQTGSDVGEQLLQQLPHQPASEAELTAKTQQHQQTVEQISRRMDTDDLQALLYRNYENPHWQEVADRCLTCANCTMVCPTCFCTTVEDVTDIEGEHSERWRQWDSCFTTDFSYIHGGSVRQSNHSRYRQWLTHKLATWHDQFDSSGCIGCGRCIAWCPVGIDLTEEVANLREKDQGTEHG